MDVVYIASIIIGVNVVLASISKLLYVIKPHNEVSGFIDKALEFFKKLIDILGANISHDDKK